MATRLHTTGGGVCNNRNNSSRIKVSFGAAPKNWKCQKSGLSGSEWRQQQKRSSRQKKMEELKQGQKRQMKHAYDILRAGGEDATRVLEFAAQDQQFKKALDHFFLAAGARQALELNQKLEWFHQKYCNRELDDDFLGKTFVTGTLDHICNSAIYLAHFRKGGKAFDFPGSSSSEEESQPMVFSRDQSRSLEGSSHPVAAVLASQLQGNFADSSSGEPPCAEPNTQQSEYPAAAASAVQLHADEN